MKHQDQRTLMKILERQAINAPPNVGPAQYFSLLIKQADLPNGFKTNRLNWTGAPGYDATNLITWALNQGTNPKDPRFTTLGSILAPILDELGLEDRRTVLALIVTEPLYLDQQLLLDLAAQYQVPIRTSVLPTAAVSGPNMAMPAAVSGPSFVWRGPADDIELQSWLKPEPTMFDVGFLKRGIERAAGICRIELANGRRGTGFLVASDLVLTNYHVFKLHSNDDLASNLREAAFRFSYVSGPHGAEPDGQVVGVTNGNSLVSSSPVERLDYALVQVDAAVKGLEGVTKLPFSSKAPSLSTGLHILQHPAGKALMIALSSNGVTGVYPEQGLFQYVTDAAGGSSGSPCFDDEWNVIGIHHAERSRLFGAVREGVLFGPIHEQIRGFLSQ